MFNSRTRRIKMTESKTPDIDIFKLLGALWKRLWLIVLAAIIGGGVAYGYAKYYITPQYSAEALLFVNNRSVNIGTTSLAISAGEISAAEQLVDTYLVILKTRSTINDVIEKTGVNYSYNQLKGMISAEPISGTGIFKVKVTSSNKAETAVLANAISEILPNRIAEIVDGSSVRVVDYAVEPTGKISPNVTKITGIGIIVGALIVAGIIVLFEFLDTAIHDEDYLTRTYKNIPILSIIPEISETSGGHGGYYSGYGYGYSKPRQDDDKTKKGE